QTSGRHTHHRAYQAGGTSSRRETDTLGGGDDRLDDRGAWHSPLVDTQRGGVCLHDTASSLSLDDPHDHRAGFGAGELGTHRHSPAARHLETDVHDQTVLLGCGTFGYFGHLQPHERVGVEPGTVPGVEAVGDHVLGLTASRHALHRRDADGTLGAFGHDRCLQGFLTTHVVKTYPYQYTVVVYGVGAPAGKAVRSQGKTVPATHQAALGHCAPAQGRTHVGACPRAG